MVQRAHDSAGHVLRHLCPSGLVFSFVKWAARTVSAVSLASRFLVFDSELCLLMNNKSVSVGSACPFELSSEARAGQGRTNRMAGEAVLGTGAARRAFPEGPGFGACLLSVRPPRSDPQVTGWPRMRHRLPRPALLFVQTSDSASCPDSDDTFCQQSVRWREGRAQQGR